MILEKVSTVMDKTIAHFAVKDNCLKAGILYLCIPDYVAVNKYLRAAVQKHAAFRESKEAKFLEKLIKAASNRDTENFAKKVAKWRYKGELDSFKEKYLEIAFEKILEETPEGEEDYT